MSPQASGREPALADDLRAYYEAEQASFHMPGHKQRLTGLHPSAAEVLGPAAIRADVSEMGGFDYLHAPAGALAEAQSRAAVVFGADRTFFLVNGSTGGNLSAITALVGDGDHLVMLRGSHRSVYTAAALAGAVPTYLPMRHHLPEDGWFVAEPPSRAALPDRVAVIHVTRPNYYGMACDLAPYVALARETGAILVVDEAHGSHFGLHPALPRNALHEGADVVIQSTHKTLGGLTQASMLHVRGDRVDATRIARSLQMLQSSSPSALLSISLDLAAAHMADAGEEVLRRTVALARRVRADVARLPGLRVLGAELLDDVTSAVDPTKVVIDVHALGRNGFSAARFVKEHARINVELADHRRIVCSLTIGDDDASADLLIDALTMLSRASGDGSGGTAVRLPDLPPVDDTPRRALQRPTRSLALDACEDRTCAEYVIPYPPGIPLVVPGERLTRSVIGAVREFTAAGSRIVGPADPSGRCLEVL